MSSQEKVVYEKVQKRSNILLSVFITRSTRPASTYSQTYVCVYGDSRISTTVWLHHLDFSETLGEKVRWELNKAAVLNKSRETG